MIREIKYIALSFILIAVIASGLVLQQTCQPTPTARAVVLAENNFDDTRIEDDLADIDLDYYMATHPGDTPRLVQFVEYCYSNNAFKQQHYGLYLYIYNPSGSSLSMKAGNNTVSIATAYDSAGEPTEYANFSLTYLDKTDGDYNNKFYKFRITDAAPFLTLSTEYAAAHNNERRYDIAGVQLRESGATLAEDFGVGGTWHYTGYAKGCGVNTTESTLDCEITDLETVALDVRQTFYRPEGTNGPGNAQDTLYSVYFAVPNRLLEEYGGLYSVTAEWLYAQLKPMFVVADSGVNDKLRKIAGQIASAANCNVGFATDLEYSSPVTSSSNWFTWNANTMFNLNKDVPYNEELGYYKTEYGASVWEAGFIFNRLLSSLYFSFYADLGSDKTIEDYSVSAEEILEYMEEYSRKDTGAKILDKYSESLFESYDKAKTVKTITRGDNYSLTDAQIGDSLWDRIWGLKQTETYDGIEAIHEVTAGDFNGIEGTCRNLYINENDYTDFVTFYNASVLSDKTVYLLRFAVDDNYTARYATVFEHADNADTFDELFDGQNNKAYLATGMAMYMDFDIIYMTYEKAGEYYVIAAVADPIDIISDITSPPYDPDDPDEGWPWWVIMLIIIACVIVLLLLWPILWPLIKLLLKGIVWIICLPFRFIGWIVKKIRGDDAEK